MPVVIIALVSRPRRDDSGWMVGLTGQSLPILIVCRMWFCKTGRSTCCPFVEMLVMSELGFERSQAGETGRPGYDPRDLLKLYLYGYLNQIRSSRRLEAECRRNVEFMWLLGRLYPDQSRP